MQSLFMCLRTDTAAAKHLAILLLDFGWLSQMFLFQLVRTGAKDAPRARDAHLGILPAATQGCNSVAPQNQQSPPLGAPFVCLFIL